MCLIWYESHKLGSPERACASSLAGKDGVDAKQARRMSAAIDDASLTCSAHDILSVLYLSMTALPVIVAHQHLTSSSLPSIFSGAQQMTDAPFPKIAMRFRKQEKLNMDKQ